MLNSIFLDLANEIKSLLTTLSPRDSLSNCSVTTVLVPLLEATPVSNTWRVVSLIVVVVVTSKRVLPLVNRFL
jgi:hypothetical protein